MRSSIRKLGYGKSIAIEYMNISVIVPLYRGGKYIQGIIRQVEENILKIDDKDFRAELILINDDPESSLEKEEFYSNTFEIILYENDHNCGIHASRLKGLEFARGEYVLFLDQDDYVSPGWMISQLEHIGNADVAVSNGYEKKEKGQKILYRYLFMQITVKYLWFYAKYGNRILSPGQCLIRREAIPKEWTEIILKNNGCDDAFLWWLMLSKKRKFALNREKLYVHRYTTQNYSLEGTRMRLSSDEYIEKGKGILPERYLRIAQKRNSRKRKYWIIKFTEGLNTTEE